MERDQLEVDVVFVGAGPASLAGAFHLSRLVREHNASVDSGKKPGGRLEEPTILVIEKGKRIGAHSLSGAIVDPRGFDELLEGRQSEQPPYDALITDDHLYFLTSKRAFRSPVTPAPLLNHGLYVASLGKLVEWMAGLCEQAGVEVYPEFPAVDLLFEDRCVRGVRIGDKGRDKDGNPKANFEPGLDVLARATVLGEGPRGTLARKAFDRLRLKQSSQPQVYAVGVKEVWKVPGDVQPGLVYHTLGFPLGSRAFGGGFIYTRSDSLIDVGFVTGLDYQHPHLDPHLLLQDFKTHPFVREFLRSGKPISYGAKAIPEGGYYAMPRLHGDGLLIIGDSAGFLDSRRLKGIHLAVKSGMMAAETLFEALARGDYSAPTLAGFTRRFEQSWAKTELWGSRNFRQSFQKGFWSGLLHSGVQSLTAGRGLRDPMPITPGHVHMKQLSQVYGETGVQPPARRFDGELTLDKSADIYLSDTAHEEDQPCHLKILDPEICTDRCSREYGNPCRHFCPADVYEMRRDPSGFERLQINFTNCVHCKTCDIMDPYQIISWTPPEGGGGPDWKNM